MAGCNLWNTKHLKHHQREKENPTMAKSASYAFLKKTLLSLSAGFIPLA